MIPKHLRIKNFLSHDYSELNFDEITIALVLGSFNGEFDISNGSGKSSVLEAIAWSLFGKSRHKKKNGVVKRDKPSCEVEFEFYIDDVLYKVKRLRDKTLNDSDITIAQWNDTNQSFTDISCDTNPETDKKIVGIIGINYDVFINSVYFKQKDIDLFTNSTPTKRKEVLKHFLKIDQWDKYQGNVKEHIKLLNAKIEEKSQHLVSIDAIKKEAGECKNLILALKEEIKNINKEYEQFNSDLVAKRVERQSIGNSNIAEQLRALQKNFSDAKKKLSEINKQKNDNDITIKNNTEKISSTKQKINIFGDKISAAKDINLDDLRNKIMQGKTKEKIIKDRVKFLESNIDLDKECINCKKPLTKNDIQEIKERRKVELPEEKKRYSEIEEQLSRAQAKLKNLESLVDEAHRFIDFKNSCWSLLC